MDNEKYCPFFSYNDVRNKCLKAECAIYDEARGGCSILALCEMRAGDPPEGGKNG